MFPCHLVLRSTSDVLVLTGSGNHEGAVDSCWSSEVGRQQNNNNCAEMELCEILYNKAEYIETVC